MPVIHYRSVGQADIAALAKIRTAEGQVIAYWNNRISGYLNHELQPQKALNPRVIYVALVDDTVVGFIAGHLTTRFDCDGELQWIDIITAHQRTGIASALLHLLFRWLTGQQAKRICVNVAPENIAAKKFYEYNCAESLNEHWMVWRDISKIIEDKLKLQIEPL